MADYDPTPLFSLDNLAAKLGVAKVYVKDESFRFGLNSFKALGCSYGMANLLAGKLGIDPTDITDAALTSADARKKIEDTVFVSATDGNHGRGVAWCAARYGCRAIIYLPKAAAPFRVEAIQKEGAEAHVTDLNYDDSVRLATQKANENGWALMQDTAMPGYEQIPGWIMQGYTTMVAEALKQIAQMGGPLPTHVFLQAGDGKPHRVVGDLETIMAGLACGEPNPMGWEILRDYADVFVSCPDYVTAEGMRRLANPIGVDRKIVSGESGAVGIGLLASRMGNAVFAGHQKTIGLDTNSVVLVFSTEGDTDPDGYRKIVHDGQYSSPV